MTFAEIEDVVCVLGSELMLCVCNLHEMVHTTMVLYEGVIHQSWHFIQSSRPPKVGAWVINDVASLGHGPVPESSLCVLQSVLHPLNSVLIVATILQELVDLPSVGSAFSHTNFLFLEVLDRFSDRICEVDILWHPDDHSWQVLLTALELHLCTLRRDALQVAHILILHIVHEVATLRRTCGKQRDIFFEAFGVDHILDRFVGTLWIKFVVPAAVLVLGSGRHHQVATLHCVLEGVDVFWQTLAPHHLGSLACLELPIITFVCLLKEVATLVEAASGAEEDALDRGAVWALPEDLHVL